MNRKNFNECVKDNYLFESKIQKQLAEELLELAEHKEKFWKTVKKEAKQFPSLFIEGYYEIIKELCAAVLALDGWKALNHECLFAYLKHRKGNLEIDFDYLLELKDLRNSIDYRGTKISYELWKNNEMGIILTVKALKEYLKEKIN